jgi:DNA-binding response OmpR family regulator
MQRLLNLAATAHEFDAIVLDIGLPRLNGFTLMQTLRGRGTVTPALMLTARDSEDDIIRGLDLGADDYLTKPFSFAELVARLQSITRPSHKEKDGKIEAGDVIIDPIRHSVTRNMKNIDLTRREFLLLTCLVRRDGQCVPRQTLIEFIWGPNHPVGGTALDVLVNSLRAKIDAPFKKRLIGTVRGSGYSFRCASACPGENA